MQQKGKNNNLGPMGHVLHFAYQNNNDQRAGGLKHEITGITKLETTCAKVHGSSIGCAHCFRQRAKTKHSDTFINHPPIAQYLCIRSRQSLDLYLTLLLCLACWLIVVKRGKEACAQPPLLFAQH
jgi:hypothetical protein